MRFRKWTVAAAALAVTGLGLVAGASSAGATTGGNRVAYSSIVPLTAYNLPSVGAEAYAFNEFGNEVTLSASYNGRAITTAVLQLSSWACQSGSWITSDCLTTPGATFQVPMTLNIYEPPSAGGDTPGALIESVTQTFAAPYRPSTDLSCGPDPSYGGAYTQWRAPDGNCYHGLLADVVFRLPGMSLPPTFVFGVSYNTTHYGPSPVGESAPCFGTSEGCPYDSLNIALSQDTGDSSTNVTVGSDTNVGTVWQNSPYGSQYCDGGAAGAGTFRLDSPGVPSCWGANTPSASPYFVPAIEFATGAA